MLLKNLDLDGGGGQMLVNGSRGVVTEFVDKPVRILNPDHGHPSMSGRLEAEDQPSRSYGCPASRVQQGARLTNLSCPRPSLCDARQSSTRLGMS